MQVQLFVMRYITLKKAARQRIAKAEAEHLCVACLQPLGDGTVKRGCHEKCYRATLRAIEKGKTTEADRVQDGKLLARDLPGRRPSNPVSVEFA